MTLANSVRAHAARRLRRAAQPGHLGRGAGRDRRVGAFAGRHVKERADGPFGIELVGTLKVDGRPTPVRFIGVDGPRWFLRAMLVGAVASDPAKARPLEDALRNVVVVRGSDPLPVREQVPLHLPTEAVNADGRRRVRRRRRSDLDEPELV